MRNTKTLEGVNGVGTLLSNDNFLNNQNYVLGKAEKKRKIYKYFTYRFNIEEHKSRKPNLVYMLLSMMYIGMFYFFSFINRYLKIPLKLLYLIAFIIYGFYAFTLFSHILLVADIETKSDLILVFAFVNIGIVCFFIKALAMNLDKYSVYKYKISNYSQKKFIDYRENIYGLSRDHIIINGIFGREKFIRKYK